MVEFSNEEIERYGRQIILPAVGGAGQKKISQAKVLCIGAGGLGSPVALYLAAAGVGTIGLVDSDKVDLSNLQRQILHDSKSIGVAKVESAKKRLLELNPGIKVNVFEERFSAENAAGLVRQFDLVVDGSDNFETRYIANDACFFEKKPLVFGAVFQFEGRATVFSSGGPCYRCVFPNIPQKGAVPSCREAGVIGAVTGIIGSIQAAEAIKLILQKGESLSGRLLIYDSLSACFSEIKLKKDEKCALCGSSPTILKVENPQSPLVCGAGIASAKTN